MIRHKIVIWGLAATISAITLASTATATALAGNQGRQPDGSPSAAAVEPAAPVSVTCLNSLFSIVRTDNSQSATSSTAFVALPGATATFTVPAGQTRCIKVLFTAETSCPPTAAIDFCYVRARDNGVDMSPQGGDFQAIDSESLNAKAHAYEWVARVGAGSHTITMQRRVGNAATSFGIDDWTFDVQVYK